jgi:hypothetical protein
MIHPITFSIPSNKIVADVPSKTKFCSDSMPNLIPGRSQTYVYQNEEDYYKEYQSSFFAITTKKHGWDCMRHYEIMANGCIPYFPDIEKCPPNTMALLPKHLIVEGNKLYASKEIDGCHDLIKRFLDFTRENLTTKRMAQYILDKSGYPNSKKILFLSGSIVPDYLRCLTLQGFKELLSKDCHDFPKVLHIYKNAELPYSMWYGKGFTYTNNVEDELHDVSRDSTIENDIKSNYYDLIIYGSFHRGMPYYDMVCESYDPSKIILLCGEDMHRCNSDVYLKKGHTIFVREL